MYIPMTNCVRIIAEKNVATRFLLKIIAAGTSYIITDQVAAVIPPGDRSQPYGCRDLVI